VLGCLPDAALDTLAERARPRSYAAGETVFEEGAPGDCMHLVRSGALEVWRTEGVERYVLAHLAPGHAFGELAALDRTPRTATVVAIEDSETVEIGVPAVLFSRQITGPLAVVIAYVASIGLYA